MNNDALREGAGFDIVINGVNKLFAELALDAVRRSEEH
jgi:hypothetical protein